MPGRYVHWLSAFPISGLLFVCLTVASVTATGNLTWQNRGQATARGAAFSIGAHDNVVVAVGNVCDGSELIGCDAFIRAHDARTGVTLWEDRFDVANGWDRLQDVAVDAGRAFGSGWVFSAAGGFDFVIRAYGLNHGALLWQRRIDRGLSDFADALTAEHGRVFASGRVRGPSGGSDLALIAFDAQTGKSLWESVTDPSGLRVIDIAFAVHAQGDRVFVAGTIFRGVGRSLVVRAHDAGTGEILWEDQVADATNDNDRNQALAIHGNLLFVGGSILSGAGESDFLVRAYDGQTGALVWEDRADQQSIESATALAFGNGQLFAAGYDCDRNRSNCHVDIRAYNGQTGVLLWKQSVNDPGGDAVVGTGAVTVEAHGEQVFVGGSILNSNGRSDWTVLAYDAQRGNLEWQDRVDGGGFWNQPNELSALGRRLYAAGFITRPNENSEFTVRAYTIR